MLCTVGVVRRQSGRYRPESAAPLRLCRLGATGFDASAAGSHCAKPGSNARYPGFGCDTRTMRCQTIQPEPVWRLRLNHNLTVELEVPLRNYCVLK